VKHAIEVLQTLESRFPDCRADVSCPLLGGITSLNDLLRKPHETDSKVPKDLPDECKVLATKLYGLIVRRKRNFRAPNLNAWAADIDKIIRLDGRCYEQVLEVIEWCQQDNFWQNNILSAAKLRLQLDKLEIRMDKDFNWKRRRSLMASTGKSAKDKYMESLKDEADTGVNG
jgi:hypothetical protein